MIDNVPHGVAQSQLGALVNMLRPFGRSVSATLAPHSPLYRAYQDIGLKNIGFALDEFGAHLPDQHKIEELALFARRNRLGTFVSHINNINILKFFGQDAADGVGIPQFKGSRPRLFDLDEDIGFLTLMTWTVGSAGRYKECRKQNRT